MLGTTEIILIIAGIILLFGAKKLPGLMKGMARGIQDFKKELKEPDEQASTTGDDDEDSGKEPRDSS